MPLLGFVLSLKDSIIYKGSDCTLGFQSFCNHHYKFTSKLIEHIESKGAIVTCKGNVGQTLMMTETVSNTLGATSHPNDPNRTAGGSSGGDAVLVAHKLVNGALATDLIGDLRIPSLYCGIYGFKPTATRFAGVEATLIQHPFLGTRLEDHQPLLFSTVGTMAHNVDDLEALTIALNSYNEVDKNLPPLPWNKPSKPTRIGVIKEFTNILELCGTAKRALKNAVDALKSEEVSGMFYTPVTSHRSALASQ